MSIGRNDDGNIAISWLVRKGRSYGVDYCDGGLTGDTRFLPLGNLTNLIAETDGLIEVVDSSAPGSALRFYRVRVSMP